MTTTNPYSPPRAAVNDLEDEDVGFSDPKIWSASGRIGRLRYMAYMMMGYLIFAVIGGVTAVASPKLGAPVLASLLFGVGGIAYLVLVVFSAIQRSHDMDWSGWTILLAIIPLVGLIWIFKGGTPGGNRFGAPPSPNTLGVKIAGSLFPAVFVIGILAAIALPAYQQYVARAHAAQGR